MQQLDSVTCRRLLVAYDSWFGPPLIELEGYANKVLDGRMRFRECLSLGITPPKPLRLNPPTAVHYLCLAGHYERARELLTPANRTMNASELSAWAHCDREVIAPLFVRTPRIAAQQHTRAGRRDVLKRVIQLYQRGRENLGTVSCDDLQRALGSFL